ncbi:LysR substrate-binding domain-containing protein [Chromohalobacter sp.]|uniref:LysR substrate-binding domain-containing protein n=1 Tax=Chromohalobacter sp. TaxID=50740 RepID=UPI003241D752
MKEIVHLQSFLAVARTGSLTLAAEELHVTPSAVSHRLRQLEQRLGVKLLRRTPHGMALTGEGQRFKDRISDPIEAIEMALHPETGQEGPLTVSVMPWFASSWLMPRLKRFQLRCPDARIRIETSSQLSDLAHGHVTAALRFGRGDWPEIEVEPLFDEWVIPVASPDVVEQMGLNAQDPARWPRLPDPDNLWSSWFGDEVMGEAMRSGIELHDTSSLTEAAVNGMGVVLGRYTHVAPWLERGDLVTLASQWIRMPKRHYLVRSRHRPMHSCFPHFRRWLHDEVQRDRAGAAMSSGDPIKPPIMEDSPINRR